MIDWVSAMSISALRLSISAWTAGSATSTAMSSPFGSGSRLAVIASTSFSAASAWARVSSVIHLPLSLAGDQPVLFQPLAQHLDLDVERAAVVLEEMRALGGEALLEVAEQLLVGLARLRRRWLRLQTSANLTVASRSPSR